jgi:methoxymalonate biosynthesis acyl carrier protein
VQEIKAAIREFLARFFKNQKLNDDDDIFAMGFVNSLLALQLVNFLQKQFQITIDDEDLDLDNFRTLNRMASLVERKSAIPARVSEA